MSACVVKHCKNYYSKQKKSQGITFHKFPTHEYRRDEWVRIIRNCRGDSNWNPTSTSTVCSVHFDDIDFIITPKGIRRLDMYALPSKLLSNSAEMVIQAQSTSSSILEILSNVKGTAQNQEPPSLPSTISDPLQLPAQKDEFVLAKYCRLCATSICDGKFKNVQTDNILKKFVVNTLSRLNTNIDFSEEHLPTNICSECVKSLYTAYCFIVGIEKAQMNPNLILCNSMELSRTSLMQLSSNIGAASSSQDDTPRNRRLKYKLKKKQIIDMQKKKLKRLNQKVRRLRNRNESLTNILKPLKKQIMLAKIYLTR